jgi:hypothetical protein
MSHALRETADSGFFRQGIRWVAALKRGQSGGWDAENRLQGSGVHASGARTQNCMCLEGRGGIHPKTADGDARNGGARCRA